MIAKKKANILKKLSIWKNKEFGHHCIFATRALLHCIAHTFSTVHNIHVDPNNINAQYPIYNKLFKLVFTFSVSLGYNKRFIQTITT
ncbi:MAG: hypothetical protein WCG25_08035 [bacterium]